MGSLSIPFHLESMRPGCPLVLTEGSDRTTRLCALLVEAERHEDIARMGSDHAFREQVVAELGV